MIFFYIVCFITLLVGIKVNQWERISLLGFPLETPSAFIRNSAIYHCVFNILFIVSIISFIISIDEVGLLIGLMILIFVFIGSAGIGHKLACKIYRREIGDIIIHSSDENEKDELKKALNKTDGELLKMTRDNDKYL